MKLPRSYGPLKATPGCYYYTAILREVPVRSTRITKQTETLTLLPETLFWVEGIVLSQGVYAKCRSHPHGRVFHLRISGQELFNSTIHPIKSALVLLAMQSE